VFEEVSLIKGDYAKGVYLRELMKSQELDFASAERVVTQAAREMKSDYEKRQVLSMAPEKYLDDQKLLSELITATATTGSDKAPAIVVAETCSGVPRMRVSGEEVVIAWTDSRNVRKVRTAILRMTGN
jgi:hypothetical protein